MERLTEWNDYGVALCGQKCEHNEPISDPCTEHDCHQRLMKRLAAYEDALTLPDGTVMGPEEIAALRARCEAAEAEQARFVQIDGDPFWHPTYGDPDSGGQNAGRYYYKDAGRGPQEGVAAHERV